MTEYIRGFRQFKAIFIFIEQLWLIFIGQDSRGLDEEEKHWVVYSGMKFRQDRFRCARRELEIFFGLAKPYKIVFAPSFWDSLRRLGATEKDIKEFRDRYTEKKKK